MLPTGIRYEQFTLVPQKSISRNSVRHIGRNVIDRMWRR